MQEDIEQRSISVTFQATKFTARTLQRALAAALRKMKQAKETPKVGRNSLKRVAGRDGAYEEVEVGKESQLFEKLAKRNKVRYHIEKDSTVTPPRWRVNFKAPQAGAIERTFRQYTRLTIKRENRPSLRAQLQKLKELVKETPAKARNREHEAPGL